MSIKFKDIGYASWSNLFDVTYEYDDEHWVDLTPEEVNVMRKKLNKAWKKYKKTKKTKKTD